MIVGDGALAGKTAVITGASSGIGLAAANRFHDLGATVTALARRREAMQEGIGDRAIDLRCAADVRRRGRQAKAPVRRFPALRIPRRAARIAHA